MEFLSDLAVVLGIAGVLGTLSATLYIAIEIRAAGLAAEKSEEHLAAIRRDMRLLASLTMKSRTEASTGRARLLEQLQALKPPPLAPTAGPGLPRLSARSVAEAPRLGPKAGGPAGTVNGTTLQASGRAEETCDPADVADGAREKASDLLRARGPADTSGEQMTRDKETEEKKEKKKPKKRRKRKLAV